MAECIKKIWYVSKEWNVIQPRERRKSSHLQTWVKHEDSMLSEINRKKQIWYYIT